MVHRNDQQKTTFTTPWGAFMYVKMPFGMINVGATFQMEMYFPFNDEIGRFIFIYLDDINVLSKTDEEQMLHLRKVIEKCRKYGISLNPKKTLFWFGGGKTYRPHHFQGGH